MSHVVDERLVSELARDLLTDVAPNELTIFPAVSRGFFASGGKIPDKKRDEALGFGLDASLITPYLLSALGAVTAYLADEVLKTFKDEAAEVLSNMIKKLFKKKKKKDGDAQPDATEVLPEAERVQAAQGQTVAEPPVAGESLALTAEQASKAHRLALERAEALGLPSDKAKFLADAIVGSLVVA